MYTCAHTAVTVLLSACSGSTVYCRFFAVCHPYFPVRTDLAETGVRVRIGLFLHTHTLTHVLSCTVVPLSPPPTTKAQ